MIGLDTNILACYYVASEDAKTVQQSALARELIDSGEPLCIAKTVVLELEWVLRGHYEFKASEVWAVFEHLLSLPHAQIEDRPSFETALVNSKRGLDFADAYHHASYSSCRYVASFDDRRFAKRVKALAISPPVLRPE